MEQATRKVADLLLLPQCFITGYRLPIENKDALADDSEWINTLCAAARNLQIGVIATAFTRGKNKPQNSAFLIDKDGICVDNTIFLADEMTEELYYADFDMEQLRAYQEREMLGNTFRKVKAYQDLLSDHIAYPFIREGQ